MAIKQVLGDHAYKIPVSGTKGYYGHALGASGAIEAAICAGLLQRGWLPPTVNLLVPDAECDLTSSPHRPGRPPGAGAVELLRLRRHQRLAGDAARVLSREWAAVLVVPIREPWS